MNAFLQFASECKASICDHIERRMGELLPRYDVYGRWAKDAMKRITRYTQRGKMIRGTLVLLAHRSYHGGLHARILDAAAGVELLQSFLLMHDDIMDQDALRRGEKSIHMQYAAHLKHQSDAAALHYGNSMAICCGDIAFALANVCIGYALNGSGSVPMDIRSQITELYNSEVVRVGVAQMDDITFSSTEAEPSVQDVLELYRNKTGHYSIVLPLKLGALLANQQQELSVLQQIGVALGEVFQIRDDLLGFQHGPEPGGKSIFSDLVNKKKTYMRQLLIAGNDPHHLKRLADIEAHPMPNANILEQYRVLLEDAGVLSAVADRLSETNARILARIDTLRVCRSEEKELLRAFCVYNSQRQR